MSSLDRVLTAKRVALSAHGKQMYGDFPYEYHLEKVQEIASQFVTDDILSKIELTREELKIAIYFHDCPEDTCLNNDIIAAMYFGTKIPEMVYAVQMFWEKIEKQENMELSKIQAQ